MNLDITPILNSVKNETYEIHWVFFFKGKNKKKYVIYRHICNKLKKIKIRP